MTDDRFSPVALAPWLDAAGLPGQGEPLEVAPLTGGTQHVLLELRRGAHAWVLRAGREQTMQREVRLLRALAGTDVPHAALRAACPDPIEFGVAFYVMDRVDGWSPMGSRSWPSPFDTDVEQRRQLALELVRGAAAMRRFDWQAAGLVDLGRPDGFHDRQVDRWLGQLGAVHVRELPGVDEAAAWLRDRRPRVFEPGLMHGDYQMANVMFTHGSPVELAAIIDWEMATIGDPLLDLGWILAYWPDPSEEPPRHPYVDLTGMPTHAELVEAYERASGEPVRDVDYYVVLARFKLAIVLELGYVRGLRRFGPMVLDLAAKAGARAARSPGQDEPPSTVIVDPVV